MTNYTFTKTKLTYTDGFPDLKPSTSYYTTFLVTLTMYSENAEKILLHHTHTHTHTHNYSVSSDYLQIINPKPDTHICH